MKRLVKLKFKPGFNAENTGYTEGPAWIDGNLVRFWKGYPQKMGGWTQEITGTYLGYGRAIHAWRDLSFNRNIALATHKKLYIEQGGTYYDVTPIVASGSLSATKFSTTSGSTTYAVTHSAHGIASGDYILLSGSSTDIGGIDFNDHFEVQAVADTSSYTIASISASSTATSTVSGSGDGYYKYLLSTGRANAVAGLGWGAGTWGQDTWGTPRSTSSFVLSYRTWTLRNWGEDLLAGTREGDIYIWDASVGTGTRATIMDTAAPECLSFVVGPDRSVIALGCEASSGDNTIDKLLIRWCDSEDYTDWIPSATNTAGFLRVPHGSEIITGILTRREILVGTDESVWSLQYVGGEFTYGLDLIAFDAGFIGPHAMVDIHGTVYWMSRNNFHSYDGAVHIIPCSIHTAVFDNINIPAVNFKVYAGHNEVFNEVIWLWADEDETENNRYAILNYNEGTWVYGSWNRSTWHDAGEGIGDDPIATTNEDGIDSGVIYNHENDNNAATSGMSAWIQSGDFEMEEGSFFSFIDMLIPDATIEDGPIAITLKTLNYPHDDSPVTKGPYEIESDTKKISLRARGRQWNVRVESSAEDVYWRWGDPRARIRPDGRQN